MPSIPNMSSAVRPAVTIVFALALVAFTALRIVPAEAFITLCGVVINSWFQSRQSQA